MVKKNLVYSRRFVLQVVSENNSLGIEFDLLHIFP